MSVLWITSFAALFPALRLCYNLVRSLRCIFVGFARKTAGGWGYVGARGVESPLPRLGYPHPQAVQLIDT